MKSKGFTLIELLAVIVIIGVLVGVAIPSVIAISKKIKTNMFCTKIQEIEKSAELYGEDNINLFKSSCTVSGGTYPCLKINNVNPKISNLLSLDYLTSDDLRCIKNNTGISAQNSTTCINSGGTWTIGKIVDPRDKKSSMNNVEIIIYKKYNRVYAKIEKDQNNVNMSTICD